MVLVTRLSVWQKNAGLPENVRRMPETITATVGKTKLQMPDHAALFLAHNQCGIATYPEFPLFRGTLAALLHEIASGGRGALGKANASLRRVTPPANVDAARSKPA